MKLKEKLASDWCNKDELIECARDDLPFIYDEAYIAGFEKARELCIDRMFYHESYRYDLIEIGEEEVE